MPRNPCLECRTGVRASPGKSCDPYPDCTQIAEEPVYHRRSHVAGDRHGGDALTLEPVLKIGSRETPGHVLLDQDIVGCSSIWIRAAGGRGVP